MYQQVCEKTVTDLVQGAGRGDRAASAEIVSRYGDL